MTTHYVSYGDTLTPLGAILKQKDATGVLAAVNLTGLTVKAFVTDDTDQVVVTETTVGVTVVTASEGKVQYDFQGGASLLPVGKYYMYFRVYTGSERDTYPARPRQMQVIVQNPAP